MKRLVLCLLALVLAQFCLAADVVTVETLATRPGVTQRFIYLAPSAPVASVILLAGGSGDLRIHADGRIERPDNFLVRTRDSWMAQGFQVAVLDSPSDLQEDGMDTPFRQSADHATDIAAVITFLKQHGNLPVWLVGTSRGTISAVAAGIRLNDSIAGVVLTSSIVNGRDRVTQLDLDRLTHPVLVVTHRLDGCKQCSPSGSKSLSEKFSHAPFAALMVVEGGVSQGDPCQPWAYHGFNGVEDQVVKDIADWIKAPHR